MRLTGLPAGLTFACSCLVVLTGCDKPPESMPQLGGLPGLRRTEHSELRAELSRLEADRATPELLEAPADDHSENAGTPSSPEQVNREFEEIISSQQLQLILQRLDQIYPKEKFQCGPVALENLILLRTNHAAEFEKYREILGSTGFQFRVALSAGLLADLSFLDHARFAHRLEAIDAATALAENRVAEAMLPINKMFEIDRQLGTLKHVASRLTAAKLRAETLGVIAALVEHAQCSKSIQQRLLKLVEGQLASWPADVNAWMGDRALGLHAYELVRAGHLLNILTSEETREMRQGHGLEAFVRAVILSIDDDQWFYLQSMRRVIDCCQGPYHTRRSTFGEINNQLFELRETPRYPLFAATILLRDIAKGHREQALDRARCEAWALALGIAVGRQADTESVNPVTGDAYQLTTGEQGVKVQGIDGTEEGETVSVPFRHETTLTDRR